VVRNDGDTLWLHEEDPAGGYVLLSAHLIDEGGHLVRHGFFRQPLPRAVAPGETLEVTATVPLPSEAGRYGLRIDLVDEQVMWFAQAGSAPLDLVLEVERARPSDEWRARIELLGTEPLRSPGGARVPLRLRLTNEGREAWPHASEPRPHTVSLAGHLLEADGAMHERDALHQALPRTVAAGESVDVVAFIRAPRAPGTYRLKLDLVMEHVCWFEQRGSVPLERLLVVTDDVPDSANPGLLRATLERLDAGASASVRCGANLAVRLRATNLGNTRWLHAARPGGGEVALGAHLLNERREMIDFDYLRSPLPRDVEPGEAVDLLVVAPVPAEPGRYILELDLVDEGIAWFGSLGSPTLTVALDAVS
jgi:hypothetical protein